MKPSIYSSLILFALIALASEPAIACSVCFDANDETRGAFLGTTIFLSLFPLMLIFGGAYWLYRRANAVEEPVQG